MKKRNKKKGFTLIELLAVILILGVVSLIAVPTVTSIIEESKKQSLKTSALSMADVVEQQCQIEQLRGEGITGYYTIEDGELSSPLDIKNLPDNGSIKVDSECNVEIAISDDNYCVIKKGDEVTFNSNIASCKVEDTTSEACFTFEAAAKTITGYNYDGTTCTTDVVIPSTIGGVSVEKIGEAAFTNMQLNSLILPNGIIEIGRLSFAYNNLKSILIPKGVITLGEGAFGLNQLDNVILPNSVKTIGSSAFALNNIKSIVIPTSVEYIGLAAFAYNQLESITIPDSITTLEDYAFIGNQLRSAKLPSGITTISEGVFSFNNLSSFTIPDTVTTINAFAFNNNQLKSIEFPDSVTSIGEMAFANNKLTKVILPSKLEFFDLGVFNNNQLPDSQAFIYELKEDGNFDNTILTSYGGARKSGIVIPDNVTHIGTYAFRDCNIRSIDIPPSVTEIHGGAFSGNQLDDDQAFIYARNPDGTVDYTKIASYGGAKRSNISIPSQVKTIGVLAFFSNNIKSIEIPATVTSIEEGAFNVNLLSGDQAFIYARNENGTIDKTRLVSYGGAETDVKIPNTVTTIGLRAFDYTKILSVEIPATVTKIEKEAFHDNNLTSVTIPNSVTSIDSRAFWSNSLETVNIGTGITSIGENAFEDNDELIININRKANAVSGAPWGVIDGKVNWIGSN